MLKVVFDTTNINQLLIKPIEGITDRKGVMLQEAQAFLDTIHWEMNQKYMKEVITIPYEVLDQDKDTAYKFKAIEIKPYKKAVKLIEKMEEEIGESRDPIVKKIIINIKEQYLSEKYGYLTSIEYAGSNETLKKFFAIQKELKLSDHNMSMLLNRPVGTETFTKWRSGHSNPNSNNLKQIEEIVSNYTPEKPGRILHLKKIKEYRERYEHQKERTEHALYDPEFRRKQVLKSAFFANRKIPYGTEIRLIELGKQFANSYDILTVEDLEEKYVPLSEIEELAYFKSSIEKRNKENVQEMVQSQLKINVENNIKEIRSDYNYQIQLQIEKVKQIEKENTYLKWIVRNQKEENEILSKQITLLHQQNEVIQHELFDALRLVELTEVIKEDEIQICESEMEKNETEIETDEITNMYNSKKINVINKIKWLFKKKRGKMLN